MLPKTDKRKNRTPIPIHILCVPIPFPLFLCSPVQVCSGRLAPFSKNWASPFGCVDVDCEDTNRVCCANWEVRLAIELLNRCKNPDMLPSLGLYRNDQWKRVAIVCLLLKVTKKNAQHGMGRKKCYATSQDLQWCWNFRSKRQTAKSKKSMRKTNEGCGDLLALQGLQARPGPGYITSYFVSVYRMCNRKLLHVRWTSRNPFLRIMACFFYLKNYTRSILYIQLVH